MYKLNTLHIMEQLSAPANRRRKPTNSEVLIYSIYVGTEVWSSPVVTGTGPCVLVLPTKSLSTSSTITPGTYVTSVGTWYLSLISSSLRSWSTRDMFRER